MGYGLDSIGAYDASVYPYAMNAYASTNSNYAAAQQIAQQKVQQSQTQVPSSTYVAPTVSTDSTSFRGSSLPQADYKEESHFWRNAAIGTAIVGTAACIYAYARGKDSGATGLKRIGAGFKNIWQSLSGKASEKAGEKAAEAAKKGAVNPLKNVSGTVQEFTVTKDGLQIFMKDGKPVKIVDKAGKVVEGKALEKWVEGNSALKSTIRRLDVTTAGKALPSGVTMGNYTKKIVENGTTYHVTVENGEIKAIQGISGKNKHVVDVAQFLEKHPSFKDKATTLERKIKLPIKLNGGNVSANGSSTEVLVSVQNGQLVSASIGGKELTESQLKSLQNNKTLMGKIDVKSFGKHTTGSYQDIVSGEFVYKQTSGSGKNKTVDQVIRFGTDVKDHSGKNWITSVRDVTSKESVYDTPSRVTSFLDQQEGMSTALDKLAAGEAVQGYAIPSAKIKSQAGNIFTLGSNGKIQSITLAEDVSVKVKQGGKEVTKVLKKGQPIKCNTEDVRALRQIIEYDNEFKKILDSLKS